MNYLCASTYRNGISIHQYAEENEYWLLNLLTDGCKKITNSALEACKYHSEIRHLIYFFSFC